MAKRRRFYRKGLLIIVVCIICHCNATDDNDTESFPTTDVVDDDANLLESSRQMRSESTTTSMRTVGLPINRDTHNITETEDDGNNSEIEVITNEDDPMAVTFDPLDVAITTDLDTDILSDIETDTSDISSDSVEDYAYMGSSEEDSIDNASFETWDSDYYLEEGDTEYVDSDGSTSSVGYSISSSGYSTVSPIHSTGSPVDSTIFELVEDILQENASSTSISYDNTIGLGDLAITTALVDQEEHTTANVTESTRLSDGTISDMPFMSSPKTDVPSEIHLSSTAVPVSDQVDTFTLNSASGIDVTITSNLQDIADEVKDNETQLIPSVNPTVSSKSTPTPPQSSAMNNTPSVIQTSTRNMDSTFVNLTSAPDLTVTENSTKSVTTSGDVIGIDHPTNGSSSSQEYLGINTNSTSPAKDNNGNITIMNSTDKLTTIAATSMAATSMSQNSTEAASAVTPVTTRKFTKVTFPIPYFTRPGKHTTTTHVPLGDNDILADKDTTWGPKRTTPVIFATIHGSTVPNVQITTNKYGKITKPIGRTTLPAIMEPSGIVVPSGDKVVTEHVMASTSTMGTTDTGMPLNVTVTLPVLYIEVIVKMTWVQFCALYSDFQSLIIKALFALHSLNIEQTQVLILNRELCTTEQQKIYKRSASIKVQFALTDISDNYDLALTMEAQQILIQNKVTSITIGTAFYDKILKFKVVGITEAENLMSLASTHSDILGSDTHNAGIMAGVIGGALLVLIGIMVLCFQTVLFIRRRNIKQMRYNHDSSRASLSCQSIDESIQLYSMNLKPVERFAYVNPMLQTDEKNYLTNPLRISGLLQIAGDYETMADEFAMLPNQMPQLRDLPMGAEKKNRYANVLPVADTRVILEQPLDDENSDYINANYVNGCHDRKRAYIATQAPLNATIADFWHMIWQSECQVIIMLTPLVEQGMSKSAEYWPNTDAGDTCRIHGDYEIILQRREKQPHWLTSHMILKQLDRSLCREVRHFWFHVWPPRGVPEFGTRILHLLQAIRPYQTISNGPCVVHCGPGTGRSGTVMAIDIGMKYLDDINEVDVLQIVRQLRRQRAGAVQTEQQYAFIYRVLSEYAQMTCDAASSHSGSTKTN